MNRINFMLPVYAGIFLYWVSHKLGCPIDKYLTTPLPITPSASTEEQKPVEKEKIVYIVKSHEDMKDMVKATNGNATTTEVRLHRDEE